MKRKQKKETMQLVKNERISEIRTKRKQQEYKKIQAYGKEMRNKRNRIK